LCCRFIDSEYPCPETLKQLFACSSDAVTEYNNDDDNSLEEGLYSQLFINKFMGYLVTTICFNLILSKQCRNYVNESFIGFIL
jgi:hypothetical protein